MLDLKPDWPESKERLTAWWAGEPLDRAVAALKAPRAEGAAGAYDDRVPEKWIDLDTILHNVEVGIESTYFGGESFPGHWVYHGPVPASMYFGCTPHFTPETVWYEPCFGSWEAAATWEFDSQNEWWRRAQQLVRGVVAAAQGRFLVSSQEFSGLADVIANMWGSQSLLLELAEDPQTVKRLLGRMTALANDLQDELSALVTPHQEGSFDWAEIWGPGQVFTAQNDMSCMVSPAMFEEIFLPEIRAQVDHVEHGIYHLDGPGAIKHLDALLRLENLDCIQWVPGAGNSQNPLDWLDLLRRVQGAGKRVQVHCAPELIAPALSQLDRRLVYLNVTCPDEATAQQCERELERIGA